MTSVNPRKRLFLLLVFGITALATPAWVHAQGDPGTVAVTAKILSSLALVVNPQGNSTGTAFCFYSNSSKSYFLTNKHVIANGNEILLMPNEYGRPPRLLNARIFPRPNNSLNNWDLAILVIDHGGIPPVKFRGNPVEGIAIGIAGYPTFRFGRAETLLQVTPSVHFGTINNGLHSMTDRYLEFDALTDHGNSGGPLFDQKTGDVYGVVTSVVPSAISSKGQDTLPAVQNNLALPAWDAWNFVGRSYLPYYDDPFHYIPCAASNGPPLVPRPEDTAEEKRFCGLPDAVLQ